jgi:hypothetical protein
MKSKATAVLGQDCQNSVGVVTCGDGQACVHEMNVNDGYGICSGYCDPTVVGSCAAGYSCVTIGVALVASAPLIHVCQADGSDAGPLSVEDSGGGTQGSVDAALDVRDHLLFDALPP